VVSERPWSSRSTSLCAAVLALFAMLATSSASAQALPAANPASTLSSIRSFELRLDNIVRAVGRLARDFAEPVAIIRDHPLETRVIEAKILFELRSFEGASVILLDLIANPVFQAQPEYPQALLMIGQAMKELGNTRASARYLEKAIRVGQGELRDKSQYMLIDMALNEADDQRLGKIVDHIIGDVSRAGSPRTRYALGKGLVRLERYDASVRMLSTLLNSAEYQDRARFYMATAQTALKRYDDALVEFEKLAVLAGANTAEIRYLSMLALGRIKMEQGKLDAAVISYQLIPRNSAYYEVALYEMSWGYIKAEQYDKALATIDTLLLIVKDPKLDVEAHSLRGRLNIYLNDYDRAVDSFEKIVGRFAPVRNELLAFMGESSNIGRYFEWLLERRASNDVLNAPLTHRTADWVESGGTMLRVAEVFDSLSEQRKQIRMTQEIAEELEQIVQAQNRVELFPTLKDGWTRALVLQNQLVMLAGAILETEGQLTLSTVEGEPLGELQGIIQWRKKLQVSFANLPMTFEQFEDRKKRVDERFLDLKRQAFLVQQRLKGVRRQVLALENYVNEKQFSEDDRRFSIEEERGLRDDIMQEKGNLKGLFADVDGLDHALQTASNEVGTGDVATQDEADMRANLVSAFKREANFYDSLSTRSARGLAPQINALSAVLESIWDSMVALDHVVRAIDEEVNTKIADLHGLIRAEIIHLEEYMAEMGEQDDEGRRIGRGLGKELFTAAIERMDRVVLKAEVGLIDVAWQEKRQKTEAVRQLENKRAKRLGNLSQALNELTAGEGGEL
jgi:tetratricopeptide (TPR) repeat protein